MSCYVPNSRTLGTGHIFDLATCFQIIFKVVKGAKYKMLKLHSFLNWKFKNDSTHAMYRIGQNLSFGECGN